jgi:ankyrin repeat protein
LSLDLGADINAVNAHGQSAMHGAVYRGMNGVVQRLVDKGARTNQQDARGRTPLRLAEEGFDAGGFLRRDEQAVLLRGLTAPVR